MKVTLEPCNAEEDLTALQDVFPEDSLTGDSVLVPVDSEGRWTLIRDEAFGLNTMYLKAAAALTQSGNTETLTDLKDYISRVSGDASYLSIEARESGGTLYVRVRANEANVNMTGVELTAEIGTASDEGTVYLYDTPTVKLSRDGGDVTNGSAPVYLDDALDVTLTAELVPTLCSFPDRSTPLDAAVWDLEAAGYDAYRYLELIPAGGSGNGVAVRLRSDRMPDFRVVLRARSRHSGNSGTDAGYALVFLPEERKQP